jgi:hypothetical protein
VVAQSGNVLLGQLNTKTIEEFQVAIVQVSRITNRKGIQDNLPQLAGAELGWAVDTRKLYIGNGTLAEGAPYIGNTEILTEFSDVTVLSNYTYADVVVGYAAQTGPTPGDPVVRSVQTKLDDFADIRDFGAVGDGVTDDTEAINRALYQLYCREINTQIRRSLYFPAGTYRIIESIVIPTYAKLVGEGADCTIIYMDTSGDISSLSAYVARYGDSLQQTGVNIGTNGATAPRNIEISSMSFQTVEDNDVFLVDQAEQCWFHSVNFVGPSSLSEIENLAIVPLANIAGVRFNSSGSLITNDITFDCCGFTNTKNGISTTEEIRGITVSNSKFDTLEFGISLNTNPTGFRAVHNMFDNIYAEAIIYNDVNLNVSAYNVFYNVGYSISLSSPVTSVILFGNDNNVSVNDLFERSDADAYDVPRVVITSTGVTSGGVQSQYGRLFQGNGLTFSLDDNQTDEPIFSINNDNVKAFQMFYTIARATAVRNGTMTVVSGPNDSTGAMAYTDDYTENDTTGITLAVSQLGSEVQLQYTSTSTGNTGILTYSLKHLA